MAKRVISARALKFLFASGILRGKGSGKNRTVTYDKARAATVGRNRKRGVDVTSRKKASQVNRSGRHVFGGSKAAHLRSGAGSGRRVPSKAERDATRAARIETSRKKATDFLSGGKGLALVKAVQLQRAGRTKQAAAAASEAGLSTRAVQGLGNRAKTTGREGDLRRAGFGEYGKSAISRERAAKRPITRESIQRTQAHWQAEQNRRAFARELGKALKPYRR